MKDSDKFNILKDFSYYAIVDRVGMNVTKIRNPWYLRLLYRIRKPKQSGLVAYWRNNHGDHWEKEL